MTDIVTANGNPVRVGGHRSLQVVADRVGTPWPAAAPTSHQPDLVRAEQAVADLMDALGLDVDGDGDGLRDTPGRVARAFRELLSSEPFEATTFANDAGYLTNQVAEWLTSHLRPRGAGVVIEAEHLCMSIRGVRSPRARTVTSTLLGHLREDQSARQEFLDLAPGSSRKPR